MLWILAYLKKEKEYLIIYRITDFSKVVIENSEVFKSDINSIEKNVVDLSNDPKRTFMELSKSMISLFKGGDKLILLDITTFTHEIVLILFRLINYYKRVSDKVYYIYNCANKYSVNEGTKESKWLTKGVKQIRSIISYPGYFDPSKKNHLIILFGFEIERAIRLIEEFDYDKITLACQRTDETLNIDLQEINTHMHKCVLDLYSNAKQLNISIMNPIDTKSEILNYVTLNSEYNTVIAPMNNKISTIGAGLAAIENEYIQLCYMKANQYNIEGYSEPSDDFYIFEV